MTTQKPISKSPISDAFLSKNAEGNYLSNDCFCVRCKNITGFTFTGKEKDPETGYSNFGARYLEHELMTMWLSVDPMADKYPSISPYAYCAWNPMKLVDPEGMDTIVSINIGNGHVNMESSDLHIKGCVVTFYDDGCDVPLEEYYCKGQIHTSSFANSNSDLIYFSDDSDAEKTYNYLAGKDGSWFASEVEWNYYKNMYGAESQLLTSHKRDEIDVTQFTSLGELTVQFRHFHPYYADLDYSVPSDKDIIYARTINIP